MEDLRPSSFDGIVGQPETIARLTRLADGVRSGRIVPTNLLMHGPPGVGKTTAARAFAREVLGEEWENGFNQLDADDDRSANFIRNRIAPVARLPPPRRAPFRLIFLDEADSLTPEAQSALRPLMEASSKSTVFILACNDLNGISKPMQSRCTLLEFTPVGSSDLRRILEDALAKTPFRLDEAERDAIVAQAKGIPREAIKLLIEKHGGGPRSRPKRGAPAAPAPRT